ncbi:MAG: hypothetical protein VYD70_05120 [Planctomycetota bacterium]|mgnify:CR=1 FL=1|nr:hypothetical protein [Planctomycetota bacterium]
MSIDEVTFLPSDFERFRDSVQTDPEYNDARLEVRQKLHQLGKLGAETLSKPPHLLVARASIHHPHKFNDFRIASQRVYLSRGEKERAQLQQLLGQELGQDLDRDYIHTMIVLEIDQEGLTFALRIHQQAWWDGENLKRLLSDEDTRPSIAETLQPLEGYRLRIHDHRSSRDCTKIDDLELLEIQKHYTPGDHWLHVERRVAKDDLFVSSGGFSLRVISEWKRLLPAYRVLCWHPANDRLFS